MTSKYPNIAIIDGHPDPDPERYIHALADAYVVGARDSGHDVRLVRLSNAPIPMLQSRNSWMNDPAPLSVKPGQKAMAWADHIVFIYPLWMGDMPAVLKAFLEHAFRPGFALDYDSPHGPKPLLGGKTAHIAVTMGMPAFFYRAYYGAHSVRSFKRNILSLCGIDTINTSLIGNVEGSPKRRTSWLERMEKYGRAAN